MKMADGRTTAGEAWRSKAQDFFADINTPELIQPEVPLFEKMEMWDLYLEDLKRTAKEGSNEEKAQLQKMFGLESQGEKSKDNPFSDLDDDELLSSETTATFNMTDDELEEAVKTKVPKHAFYDLYNTYFTPNSEMKIKPAPEELRWMEKLIFNANNPYAKAITENIPAYSYIACTEIIKQLLSDGNTLDEDGVGGMNPQDLQQTLDQALNNAQQKMDQMDDVCDTVGAGKVDSELNFKDMVNINQYYQCLRDVPLRDDMLRDFIKKTLKLSKSYFSSRYTEVEENILDVDQLEDLEGLENLIEPLDMFNIEEVVTHERLYHTKVNLYIDRSGSMVSYWGYSSKSSPGEFLTKEGTLETLGIAKLTALKLHAMGEVNEVRAFDHNVHEKPLDTRGLLFLKSGGGTSIDNTIEDVVKHQAPSIIITDLCDSIHKYSPDVYFIGVGDARFSNFKSNAVGQTYLRNGQCVKYVKEDHTFVKVTTSNANKI